MQSVVEFEAYADGEQRRGKAFERLGRRGQRRIGFAEFAFEPKMYSRLIADLDHAPQRLIESCPHSADNRILRLIRKVRAIEISQVVILDAVVRWAPRQMVQYRLIDGAGKYQPVGKLERAGDAQHLH